MLGHENVSVDHEIIFLSDLLEDREKTISGCGQAEAQLATKTTKRDEVEMPVAVVTFEVDAHGSIVDRCRK